MRPFGCPLKTISGVSTCPPAVAVTATVTRIVDDVPLLSGTVRTPIWSRVLLAWLLKKIGVWSMFKMNLLSRIGCAMRGRMQQIKSRASSVTWSGWRCDVRVPILKTYRWAFKKRRIVESFACLLLTLNTNGLKSSALCRDTKTRLSLLTNEIKKVFLDICQTWRRPAVWRKCGWSTSRNFLVVPLPTVKLWSLNIVVATKFCDRLFVFHAVVLLHDDILFAVCNKPAKSSWRWRHDKLQ